MNALCGVLGKCDPAMVKAMANAMKHRGEARTIVEGKDYAFAALVPVENPPCIADGIPRNAQGGVVGPADLARMCASLRDPSQLAIKGMFAAVVSVNGRWWLIRDRLGAKPLYYTIRDSALLFASELKGLLASGCVPKQLNPLAIDQFLTLRCAPGPHSIFEGVERVRPGCVVEFCNGRVSETPFACVPVSFEKTRREKASTRLRELLETAMTRSHAEHILWSAGIDCAALAALRPKSKAVFVTLKSAWQDEAWRARESARLLKVPLQRPKAHALSESSFMQAVRALDEPIADASVFPLWMIAEQAAEYTNAVMSGHGADELLGGHPRFNLLHRARGAKRLVPVNFLSDLAPAVPPNAFLRRGNRFLTSIRDNVEIYLSLISVFDHSERKELYTDSMQAAIGEQGGPSSVIRPFFQDSDLMHNLLSLDLGVGLPDLLLTECDRIGAAHGLEIELPYLDDDFVDFAVSLPPRVKYGVVSKPVLRQAMKGILPGRIRLRARRSFRVPQSGPTWRVIENVARNTITQERVEESGLFRWPYVQSVVASRGHNLYRRRQFWALLMFFAWYRQTMEG